MARPALPVLARIRWPVVLLLASVGLIAVAAVEALRTVRSSRAIASRALRDYASFAAWSYQQHLREALTMAVREVLRPVNHGESMHMSPRGGGGAHLARAREQPRGCRARRRRRRGVAGLLGGVRGEANEPLPAPSLCGRPARPTLVGGCRTARPGD